MNINRKLVEVEVLGKKMGMILDFQSAIFYQENMGESIFLGVDEVSKKMDVKRFAYLIASVLREIDENGKESLVGVDFVMQLDLMEYVDYFMNKLPELFDNSLPTEDKSKKKKK